MSQQSELSSETRSNFSHSHAPKNKSTVNNEEAKIKKEQGYLVYRKTNCQKHCDRNNTLIEEQQFTEENAAYIRSFKACTTLYADRKRTQAWSNAGKVRREIASRPGMALVTEKSVRRAVKEGKIGLTPAKAGRPPLINNEAFRALCGACVYYTKVKQVSGTKMTTRKEMESICNSCVQYKEGYDAWQGRKLYERILCAISNKIEVIKNGKSKQSKDAMKIVQFANQCAMCLLDRYWRWGLSTWMVKLAQFLHRWFDQWGALLINLQFGRGIDHEQHPTLKDEDEKDHEGEVIFM
jgi:hypothetical protein